MLIGTILFGVNWFTMLTVPMSSAQQNQTTNHLYVSNNRPT